MVSYGSMSGADLVISRAALGRGISLKGFMLGDGLAKRTTAQVRALYADLAAKLRDGVLKAPVDATYPIDDIKAGPRPRPARPPQRQGAGPPQRPAL